MDIPYKGLVLPVMLAALWVAESFWPQFTGRSGRVRHYGRNLALGLGNAALGALVFALALRQAADWAAAHGYGLLHQFEAAPWFEWTLAVVLLDMWQYFWHRLNHRVKFLWRFHAVHHADPELDASSAVRFHTGEIALSFCARMLVLPLLGMSLAQVALYEALSLPVVAFHHSNMRLPAWMDQGLRVFVVTPRMHWVHHSDWQPETDSNYASFLSVWDRLFGSFRLRANPATIHLGLDHWEASEHQGLWGMLRMPWRMWRGEPRK